MAVRRLILPASSSSTQVWPRRIGAAAGARRPLVAAALGAALGVDQRGARPVRELPECPGVVALGLELAADAGVRGHVLVDHVEDISATAAAASPAANAAWSVWAAWTTAGSAFCSESLKSAG